jgi:hypothetical protein
MQLWVTKYEQKALGNVLPGHCYCRTCLVGPHKDVRSRLGAAGQSPGPSAQAAADLTLGFGHAENELLIMTAERNRWK